MKKLLIGLVFLILAAVGFLFYAFDSILKDGIETVGSSVLQADVTAGSVGVSPLSGSGVIRELRIANPEGFDEPYVMELGGLDIAIEPQYVFSEVIIIDRIIIDRPVITYETRISTDNFRTLLNSLGGFPRRQAAGESAVPGKRVVIRDFQMRGTEVRVASTLGSAELPIPDLQLQNIGEESAAVTVAEAGRQIFAAINEQLLAANLLNAGMLRERVDEEVQELRNRAEQQVEELEQQVEEEVRNLQERVRSLF